MCKKNKILAKIKIGWSHKEGKIKNESLNEGFKYLNNKIQNEKRSRLTQQLRTVKIETDPEITFQRWKQSTDHQRIVDTNDPIRQRLRNQKIRRPTHNNQKGL